MVPIMSLFVYFDFSQVSTKCGLCRKLMCISTSVQMCTQLCVVQEEKKVKLNLIL